MSLRITCSIVCDLCHAEKEPTVTLLPAHPFCAMPDIYDREWTTKVERYSWIDLCDDCRQGQFEALRKRSAEVAGIKKG